jgi:hypothetical protein
MGTPKSVRATQSVFLAAALLLSAAALADDNPQRHHHRRPDGGSAAGAPADATPAPAVAPAAAPVAADPKPADAPKPAVAAEAKPVSPDTFEMPAACKKLGALDLEVAVPCGDEKTKSLYEGKNMGLSFSGAGSFSMPKFDKLAFGNANDPDDKVCMASYSLKDPAKIERILMGKLTPYATVAPGNGRWVNYSGVAIGKEADEGSGMSSQFDLDGENCTVSFVLGKPRKTGDLYAATEQCKSEYAKDHVLKKGAKGDGSDDLLGTLATGNRPTDAGTIAGACASAVANVAKLAGGSPISCNKTLGVGEQADPDANDSTSIAFLCKDKSQLIQSPIRLKTTPSGVVGEAGPAKNLHAAGAIADAPAGGDDSGE